MWAADERKGLVVGAAPVQPKGPPLIMVVDDSLTVRKVTARNLARHGMEVMMAKDGLDALEQMEARLPDLMLVDIEMPRMDGYELTTQIRQNPDTEHIPIVIITSRAGSKHQEKAMALGADGIALSNSALQAIGCVAARMCNTNNCPAGIATQKEELRRKLNIEKSSVQLHNFFTSSVELMRVMARACGHDALSKFNKNDLATWHREMALLSGIEYSGYDPLSE